MNEIGIIVTIVAVLVSADFYRERNELSETIEEMRYMGTPVIYTAIIIVFLVYVGVVSWAAYMIVEIIKFLL